MSCIFNPCNLVRHFHVPRFQRYKCGRYLVYLHQHNPRGRNAAVVAFVLVFVWVLTVGIYTSNNNIIAHSDSAFAAFCDLAFFKKP